MLLHGAPSIGWVARALIGVGALAARDVGGMIPTGVLRKAVEAKSRRGEGRGANLVFAAGSILGFADSVGLVLWTTVLWTTLWTAPAGGGADPTPATVLA